MTLLQCTFNQVSFGILGSICVLIPLKSLSMCCFCSISSTSNTFSGIFSRKLCFTLWPPECTVWWDCPCLAQGLPRSWASAIESPVAFHWLKKSRSSWPCVWSGVHTSSCTSFSKVWVRRISSQQQVSIEKVRAGKEKLLTLLKIRSCQMEKKRPPPCYFLSDVWSQ